MEQEMELRFKVASGEMELEEAISIKVHYNGADRDEKVT
jgi:hypothetical protein